MYNNIVLFNTFNMLINNLADNNFKIINNKYNIYNIITDKIFSEKFVFKQKLLAENYYNVRIIKKYCCFDNQFDNYIGGIDYIINEDNIKIEYLFIVDNNYPAYKQYILNDDEALQLKKALLTYIDNIAIKNNINKIIIDIHINKKFYNRYLKNDKYVLLKRCSDNPYWIEAIKYL